MNVIGLMSGTSVDGIDAALTEITGEGYQITARLIKGVTYRYPEKLRSHILDLCASAAIDLPALAAIDDAIARAFVAAVDALNVDLSTVDLIGSHGQTLFHRPPNTDQLGYSLQLGRGDLIAAKTHCLTISNFRIADIALGGQGAPLVPIIDACLLSRPDRSLAVQNIGGIGNLTYLPPWNRAASPADSPPPRGIIGWDTGPGNALIDWAVTHFSDGAQTYDRDGQIAAQGKPYQLLIDRWLKQDYFQQPPPKSTGRERFGAEYATRCWEEAQREQLSQTDFVATLTDFTSATIEHSYRRFLPEVPSEVLIGGGGSRNPTLMRYLQTRLPETKVSATDTHQLSADYKEAIAFAILAYWRLHQIPGNLPSVTGASRACLLGELWQP